MPVPFLVPLIGGLVGTAAAPAIGMSAAVAAGLGSGIATLAAGGEPEEALLSGLGGGIASGLMPGVTSGVQGLAAKGGQAAAQGAGSAAAQGAAQGAGGAAADAVTRQAIEETTRKSLAATTDAMAKKAAAEAGEKGLASMIDPKKAAQTTLKLASSSGGQQRTAPQAGPLPMNPSGNQPVSSSDALANLQMAEAPEPSVEPRSAGIEPVQVAALDEDKRIPLQKIQPVRRLAKGGLTSLAQDEMMRRGMDRLPNLGDREQAFMMAQREFAQGGYIEGPGRAGSRTL